jgi:uncharacterized membrane protein YkoI
MVETIHQRESHSMLNTLRKTALTAAALAAIGFGAAAIAGAAGKSSSSSTSSGTAQGQRPPRGPQQQLSADTAAKVKAAALDKVPGATVLRTEAGGPYGTAYHAHIKTSDGKLKVVLVDKNFNATAVQDDNGRGGPGGRHGGPGGPGGHSPETALTGDTKDKVEAAVKAKYPEATIERTETNTDGSAPYESHIRTSDGKELEVQVSKDFAIVAANEHPAHP